MKPPGATHLVVLCASAEQAAKALEKVREILGRLDLRLNEDKTRVVDLGQKGQGFDFLGYTHRARPTRQGRHRLERWPGTKAERRMTAKIKARLLSPFLPSNLPDVVGELNSLLRGWGAYFRWGESRDVFGRVDRYVCRRFALYLARKHGRRGTRWKWLQPDGTWMTIHRFLKALGRYQLCGTERRYRVTATA